MKLQPELTLRTIVRFLLLPAAFTATLLNSGALAAQSAENKPADVKVIEAKPEESKPVHAKPDTYETFYLANSPQQNDLNDMQTLLRNMLPWARIYGVPSQHAIVVYATKDDIATAHKLLADVDKKKSAYRLTYTMAEADGGKRRFSLIATSGERASMKLGDRVPIVTGKSGSDSTDTEVQYIDLGLNIDVNLDTAADSLRLRTKFEQSSMRDEKSGLGSQDPVIHQASLESSAIVIPGKPLVLGSLSLPGGSHAIEVEVVAELVK